jgi:hypothetical protein
MISIEPFLYQHFQQALGLLVILRSSNFFVTFSQQFKHSTKKYLHHFFIATSFIILLNQNIVHSGIYLLALGFLQSQTQHHNGSLFNIDLYL